MSDQPAEYGLKRVDLSGACLVPTFAATESLSSLSFVCPRCGKTNRHGGGAGHRLSHCDCWPDGYYLVPGVDEPTGRGARVILNGEKS